MVSKFSTDYRYLYEISIAIQMGRAKIDERLLTKNPGTLNYARWNTLANRILRLYTLPYQKYSYTLISLVFFSDIFRLNYYLGNRIEILSRYI